MILQLFKLQISEFVVLIFYEVLRIRHSEKVHNKNLFNELIFPYSDGWSRGNILEEKIYNFIVIRDGLQHEHEVVPLRAI